MTGLVRRDVRLVVFDPVASFVGREHSTYVNQDVRDVLDPWWRSPRCTTLPLS
jgi:hypothetical protein